MNERFQRISHFATRTRQLFYAIDVPPSAEEYRLRLQLLRRLLLSLMPVVTALLLIRGVVTILGGGTARTMFFSFVLSSAVLAIIYLITYTGRYMLTLWVTLVLGAVAILIVIVRSSSPQMDFAYFVFLPLLGATIFSLRQYVLICLFSLAGLMVARSLLSVPMLWDDFISWLIFFLLLDAGLFFGTVHRLYLEHERRQLEVEHNRLTVYRNVLGHLNHDLRTPLTVIHSCVYLAKETQQPQEQTKFLQQIDEQVYNLTTLVEKILLMAELDSRETIQPQPVDLRDETLALGDRMRLRARNKNIAFNLSVPDILRGSIGVQDWTSILNNLIENAIKYTGEGGTVNVQVTQCAAKLVIEVVDTGIGIGEEELPRIFEHFYRVDKARSSSTGGTGLGLAIVKSQVDFYKGSLTVSSQVGGGTTFRVQLPVG